MRFFYILSTALVISLSSFSQPILIDTTPDDDQTWVDAGRDQLELRFSQPVNEGSGNLTIYDADTDNVVEQISASSSNINILLYSPDVAIINLSSPLGAGKSFYVLADAGFFKDAGDNGWAGITAATEWNFSTVSNEYSGPYINSMNPNAGSAMIDYASPLNITIYFNRYLYMGSGSIAIKNLDLGTTTSYDIGHADVTVLDKVIIISNVVLSAETEYSIVVDDGVVTDYFGNPCEGTSEPNRFTFKTIPTSGVSPPAKLAIKYPSDDSQEVPVSFDQLRLSFDQEVINGTGSIDIYEESGDNLVSSFDVSFLPAWNGVAYVNFYSNNFELQPNTSYYILMNDGAFKTESDNSDVAGISDKTSWNFTTADIPRPNFISFDPADDETGVSILLDAFELQIDTDGSSYFNWGGGEIHLYRSSDDQLIKTFAVSTYPEDMYAWTSDFFLHIDYYGPQLFEPSTSYYFLVDENVIVDQNGYGNLAIADKTEWNFTTQDPDTDPPAALLFNPGKGDSDVSVGIGELEIDFDESIQFGSSGSIRLYRADNDELIVERDQYHPNIVIDNDIGNPQLDAEYEDILLDPSTTYYVLMDEGFLVDVFGNAYPGITDKATWTFTTEPSDMTPPSVTHLGPEDEATDVILFNRFFGILFDELTVPTVSNPEIEIYKAADDQLVSTLSLYEGYDQPSLEFFNGASSGYPFFFEFTEFLEGTTDYYILMNAGQFEDRFGESFGGISDKTIWNFTTEEPETVPPTAISFNPGLGATGVLVDIGELEIDFDEEIKFGSSGSIRLYRASDDELIVERGIGHPNVEIDYDGHPQLDAEYESLLLEPATDYYVQIDNGFIVDLYGNPYSGIDDNSTWTFTTEPSDGTMPAIADLAPLDDETDVSILTSTFMIAFDEETFVLADNPSIHIYKSNGDELVKEVNLYGNAGPPNDMPDGPYLPPSYYIFHAGEILEPSTDYYVLTDGNQFQDKFKNAFDGISDKTIWNFTTEASDGTAPVPNAFFPDLNSTDIAVTVGELEIDFNEIIKFGSGGKISLYKSDNDELVVSWTKQNPNIEIDNSYQLDADFSELLEPSTSYYVLIDDGFVVDIFGNAFAGFAGSSSWTFTTEASDVQAPVVTGLDPADDAVDVPININYFKVTFAEKVFPTANAPEIRLYRASDDFLISKIRQYGDVAIAIPDGEPIPTGSSFFFHLDDKLAPSTAYYITIDNHQFEDRFGIPFAGISDKTIWNFTTEDAESVPPDAIAYSPFIDETGVSIVFDELSIQFNEAVELTGNGSLQLYKSSNDQLIAEVTDSYNAYMNYEDELQVWFSDLLLDPSTSYYILIDEGFVADIFGNKYAGIQDKAIWTFTTQEADADPPIFIYPGFSPFPGSTISQLSNISVSVYGLDEPVIWNQGNVYLLDRSNDEIISQIEVSSIESRYIHSGVELTFDVTLEPGNSYYIQLEPGTITDLFGNALTLPPLSDQGNDWYFFAPLNDGQAPIISYTSPEFNAEYVSLLPDIEIDFNEAILPGSGNIRIINASTMEVIEELSVFDNEIFFDEYDIEIYPQNHLQLNTEYYVEIDAGFVVDIFGNEFEGLSSNIWNFTTIEEDNAAPEVVEYIPANGGSGISLITPLALGFDEPIKIGSGSISIFDASDDSTIGTFDITGNGIVQIENLVGVLLPTALSPGTTYYVLVDEGVVTDISGNSFGGITSESSWTFTTETGITDNESPTISSVSPTTIEGQIPITTTDMNIEFNEFVVKGTGSIAIYDAQDNLVADIDVNSEKVFAATSFVNINIEGILDFGTTYYVQITPEAFEDAYGNGFDGITDNTTWTFSTESYSGPKSEIYFSSVDTNVNEDQGTYQINLSLSEPTYAQTAVIAVSSSSEFAITDDYDTAPTLNMGGNIELNIPAGETSISFALDIIDDQIEETDQSITFTIQEVGAALDIGAANEVTITISDNDIVRAISFTEASMSLDEGAGTYTIAVETDGPVTSDQQFKVAIVAGGDFVLNEDYTLSPSAVSNEIELTLASGASSATFDLIISDDDLAESSESIEFTITALSGLLTPGQHEQLTITVNDNDDQQITGLDDELMELYVYPNPAKDYVVVPNADKVHFFDINGKMVAQKEVVDSKVDIQELRGGYYLLRTYLEQKANGQFKLIVSKR
jgi:methionine-rich copper-binding protein CopC